MKERLDNYLLTHGFAKSREQARALIMAGEIRVNGVPIGKAGYPVGEDALVEQTGGGLPFVSRGGLKLQKALEVFPIALEDRVAADIGASTGGFTDCMLQHGARRVYAVDVGYGQLDWSLRQDPRVVVMERRNARYMTPDWFEPAPSFASIDVSFISLRLILPPLLECLAEGGEAVALIKPQFEAGRAEVGKHGVVRDEKVHVRVCEEMAAFAHACGYSVRGLDHSPITGPKGNIEFLLWLKREATPSMTEIHTEHIVSQAHNRS